ncbi:MAG: hypothetical protein PWQ25_1139 [Deferribacteres bacterium]|jgi:hypothetical protein|nr:hypothetical protein [Deferribacteres bacterium]
MKKYLIIMSIFVFISCSSKKFVTYSDYVFNPQNSFTRQLKAQYTDELNRIAQKFGEYNLRLQLNGVGFTKGSTCIDCIYQDGNFWLFLSLEHENVDAGKNISKKVRGLLVANKLVKDAVFALKSVKSEKLIADNNFMGFLVSGTYGIYENINEMLKPKKFETIDIYIPKDIFVDYINGKISLNEVINFSKGYVADFESKDYQSIF